VLLIGGGVDANDKHLGGFLHHTDGKHLRKVGFEYSGC
jgi:hypothetical protein